MEKEQGYGDRVATRLPIELKKKFEELTLKNASSPAAMTRKLIADWVNMQQSKKPDSMKI